MPPAWHKGIACLQKAKYYNVLCPRRALTNSAFLPSTFATLLAYKGESRKNMTKNIVTLSACAIGALCFFTGEYSRNAAFAHFLPPLENAHDIGNLFPHDPKIITTRVQEVKKQAQDAFTKLMAIPAEERTFANTVTSFDRLAYYISWNTRSLMLLSIVSPDKAINQAARQGLQELQSFGPEITSSTDLYSALQDYAKGNRLKEDLSEEESYYLNFLLNKLQDDGLGVSDEQLDKIFDINTKLNTLSNTFRTNITGDRQHITLSKAQLTGVPPRIIALMTPAKKGHYILSSHSPISVYRSILENCPLADTRKQVYNLWYNQAYPANKPIAEEIVRLRYSLAQELGYTDYNELQLHTQMIQSPDQAYDFLHRMMEQARKKQTEEVQLATKQLPASVELTKDGRINPWDWLFIKAHYRNQQHIADRETLAQYFPTEHVLATMLHIFQNFLGLRFMSLPSNALWHPDVELIAIYDQYGASPRGYLLLDMYQREGKLDTPYTLEVASSLTTTNRQRVPAVVAIMATFAKTTPTSPALLTLPSVQTLFHEFGHAMHCIVSNTQFAGVAGTNVTQDFVEMPSQLFEELLLQPEVLRQVSQHIKTGKPLSDDLIQQILELRKMTAGDFVASEVLEGLLCLDWHKPQGWEQLDAVIAKNNAYTHPALAPNPDDHSYARMDHLIFYGPRMYCYLWSKILALDVAATIKAQGVMNPAMGKKLVKTILSRGGSADPSTLLKDFLGRDANEKAFAASYGLN